MIDLDYGETVTTLRQKIRARGRSADGLSVLLDGQHVLPDNEPYQQVTPGSSVVFSGSVKGG